ncbi:hypothetical protein GXW78_11040 [Roseomonas terrae]|uniref:Uncharacterized protein n=1 Tax=Neoroseomonas terrae TaxID=424799 RepID=A0ABS5EGQ8_9PROT|nr:hypothetical protein [Neoroseomonas terrae]MBR0650200.1 hypothetical protein [Neoroseomonas terrae]
MAPLIAPWAQAWLPAFILAAGLTMGAMAALAVGHLLGEAWLEPLRPPLAVMARGAPILLLLALPLLLAAPALYPWAAAPVAGWYDPGLLMLRGLAVLLLWIALGRMVAHRRLRGRMAGGALLLLVLTGAVFMQDWALSRDTDGAGSLQGLTLVVQQAGAAMALATLLAARGGTVGEEARTGLERALLSFAMATLWLRFVQYIVVYAADLPPEAAWYLRRSQGIWGWLEGGVGLPALLAAIGLALVPQWRRWRFAAVSLLLLVQYVVHVSWVVRPDKAPAAAPTSLLAEFVVPVVVVLALAAAWLPLWREAGSRS